MSLVFASGEDYTSATNHTPMAGQVFVEQWLDTGAGDTYWSQMTNTPSPGGTKITMTDTSPTTDRTNIVAAELVGSAA